MTLDYYDIVIVGGGPVGMALALLLQDNGISTLQLEARGLPDKVEDIRPLALSYGSCLILKRLGVWGKISGTTSINKIHISNRNSFGRTVLTTDDADVSALGYVVNYHELFRAMYETLQDCGVSYLPGATVTQLDTDNDQGYVQFEYDGKQHQVATKLLVLADGGHLAGKVEDISYHTHEYKQWAIVSNIKAQIEQTGIAYERFTADGPVALLPSGNDYALVWTVSPSEAKEILAYDDATFLTRLHQHFGDRLGPFIQAGKRSGFPLMLKYAESVISRRIALIGNAAQTLHPVAGQGLNLGLRDAHGLANEILLSVTNSGELGSQAMLLRYRKKRSIDSSTGRIFTDSLIKLFSHELALVRNICGVSLSALDCLPPLKSFVARRMIFGARG